LRKKANIIAAKLVQRGTRTEQAAVIVAVAAKNAVARKKTARKYRSPASDQGLAS
jgi:hypothetical protein